ncbi:cell division protein ZapE [Rarobacter incanus]|uniref:Cell division protein ZapE n=1 Tax=Rarobacter incanus TaxID=153494 RepID=A0A542SLQ4_9MICO|nr:cell division protein ZapE [Rarobacter incanus]TQK75561.1 cell division protein ZapE [Rarobacter incanus]
MTLVPFESLTTRHPAVPASRLIAELVPPAHFRGENFGTYVASPNHPSQAAARDRLTQLAKSLSVPQRRGIGALFGRKHATPAFYLDGGFGVGKTHLLASLAHEVGTGGAAFGTFVEYTNLVGALGFAATVEALSAYRVVCIDEFELDDPGDTVLMARLLRELADRGVALVATSNTLPEALGEGRFAADDFMREIQALAGRFEVLRIDGNDFRHRTALTSALVVADGEGEQRLADLAAAGLVVTKDAWSGVMDHLARVHPSQYGAMLDGIGALGITGVTQIANQNDALRFVVLVDRLYDRDVPVVLSGPTTDAELFTPAMLRGGYRKKYFRTLSRLGALVADAQLARVPHA